MEIIVGCLLAFIFAQEFFNRRERQKLLEAFLAKNLGDIKDLEMGRKFKPVKEKSTSVVESLNDLDDKAFNKYITDFNKSQEEYGES